MLLLAGGPVYTLDPARPLARGVAIEDGRIAELFDGSLSERPSVDLAGRAVLPGFIDAHVHFASYALAHQEVDLEPTRVVFENARVLLWGALPAPGVVDLADAIRRALPRAAQSGLAGIPNFED